MSKYSAFGTALKLGLQQIEKATVALDGATIATSGNAEVTVTASGLSGSPLAVSVAVLDTDDVNEVALKIRNALNEESDITDMFFVEGNGDEVTLRKKLAGANDATLNIAVEDDTSAGITDDTTSDAIQKL